MSKVYPGINIQWPWSQFIIEARKTVETRTYPIPPKYLNVEMALIETPGLFVNTGQAPSTAQIIGIIKFTKCTKYKSKSHWLKDEKRHLVKIDDAQFGWTNGPKWAWEVQIIHVFTSPISAPKRKGIVFTTKCVVGK